MKYYYSFKPFKVFSAVFSRQDVLELKKLASNKDVVVCKPDKGRGVVLLDKCTYIESMTKLIADRTKFEPITLSVQKYTKN